MQALVICVFMIDSWFFAAVSARVVPSGVICVRLEFIKVIKYEVKKEFYCTVETIRIRIPNSLFPILECIKEGGSTVAETTNSKLDQI